jgi:peptide/nickel transport system substrate-binding protein
VRRSALFPLVVVVSVLALAGCGGDDDGDNGGDAGGREGGTLVFGTASDPVVLDGALVSDGESLRVIDQIFETLVSLEAGSTELEPGLATEWEISDDGRSYTFQLREGVQFHDGEPFNAEAVCFNFDRWYNFEGSFQNPDASYYWQTVFGGFATQDNEDAPAESLYESCEAVGDLEVRLNLTRASSSILGALSLTNFAIASPAALREYGADEGEVDDEGVFRPTGTFGTEHPIGTGPFRFESWQRNDRLTLVRNEDYWGEQARLEQLIFRPIPDNAARLQALQAGEIHGYDLVEPQDIPTIENADGLKILNRPAFNVGYVGITQSHEPLDNPQVRQAIAHALNRQAVVDNFYAGRGEVAHQFMPPDVTGYAEDVTQYEYDPDRSRQLLEEAGVQTPVQITFCYPTDVSRPYMPDPRRNFEAFAADLNEAGFQVQPRSAPWSPDYLSQVDTGRCGLYLLGWTGDFGDPDNFVGTFFQTSQPAWGFDNPEIHDLLEEAETETDLDRREELYQQANRTIMDFLPGVPYVHTEPALAFADNIEGYEPSPVSLESFATVYFADGDE